MAFRPRLGRGLGFTADDDALLERRWPNLRLISDEAVSAKKAASVALKALERALSRPLPIQSVLPQLPEQARAPNAERAGDC